MTHIEKLALDAEIAAYVWASPDAREIEMLPLRPRTVTPAEEEGLRSRWPGRDLDDIGVIGMVEGQVHMVLKTTFEPGKLSALLRAFIHFCAALNGITLTTLTPLTPHDDSVAWLQRLYALEDPREA